MPNNQPSAATPTTPVPTTPVPTTPTPAPITASNNHNALQGWFINSNVNINRNTASTVAHINVPTPSTRISTRTVEVQTSPSILQEPTKSSFSILTAEVQPTKLPQPPIPHLTLEEPSHSLKPLSTPLKTNDNLNYLNDRSLANISSLLITSPPTSPETLTESEDLILDNSVPISTTPSTKDTIKIIPQPDLLPTYENNDLTQSNDISSEEATYSPISNNTSSSIPSSHDSKSLSSTSERTIL